MFAFKQRKLVPFIVLAIMLAITVYLWRYSERNTLEREEIIYTEHVDSIVKEITMRLDKHKIILYGSAGFFFSDEVVTKEEWQTYLQYRQLSTFYPGMQATLFAKVIQHSELLRHIEEIRKEGFLDYSIWPIGERDFYAPVIFIEPFDEQNRHFLGYDLFSVEELRSVMKRAEESNEVMMSGKIDLYRETTNSNEPGFMIFVPVYRYGMPIGTPAERDAAKKGFSLGVYYIDELMQGVFSDSKHDIDFAIYDGSEVSLETLMYDSQDLHDTPVDQRKPTFTSQKILNIFGHQWTLIFKTTPVFGMTVNRYIPTMTLTGGLLFSFLIFLYLRTIQTTSERANSLAIKITSSLKESEENFRQISENIGEVFWLLNADATQMIYVNPAYEEVWGRSCESLYKNSQSFINSVYESDKQTVIDAYAKYLKTHVFDLEYRIVDGDGKIKWIQARTFPVLDSAGKVVRHTGTAVNITNSKQLEEQIMESRQMYQSVVDTQQEMICRYLTDTTITFVNEAYCRAFGKEYSELVGQKYLMFIPPEYHEEEIASLKHLSSACPTSSREFEVTLPDGSTGWQHWTDIGIFDDSGELIEIQGTGYDITDRKQAEIEANYQTQRSEVLLRIASHMNAELELGKVKSIICEEACKALHMKKSGYLRYDSHSQLFHLSVFEGLAEEESRTFEPLSQHDVESLFKNSGKSGVIRDLNEVSELSFAQTMLDRGISTCAYSLIERDDLPLGLLMVWDDKKVDFHEDTVSILSGIAHQAASAVTNARLFSEAKNRLNQVQALRNIDLAITGSLDLRVTFQVVLDEVTKMLNTDAAAILRLDPHTGTLKYEHWRGFRSKDIDRINILLGDGYAGRMALTRKSVHVHDLRESGQDVSHIPFVTEEGFVAYYAVPLIAKGVVLGVLEVFHRERMVSNGEWLAFLETLAGQAAIAIDNAELFSKLERSNVDLLRAYDETIEGWAHALDLKDEETEDHSRRVTNLTLSIAGKMGIKDRNLANVRRGALLHDIGKMGIADSILLKPGKLTDEEWKIMRKHPVYAFEMLSSIDYLRPALDIPYCHHEKWDGSGYPRGLKGKQIPLEARIFAVVDVYDALTSDRPYRKAWSKEATLEYILKLSGTHFDPKVVDVFMQEIGNLNL